MTGPVVKDEDSVAQYTYLAPYVYSLGVSLELIQTDETYFTYYRDIDYTDKGNAWFNIACRLLTSRYQELKDAPYSWEANRLNLDEMNLREAMDFNRLHQQWLKVQIEIDLPNKEFHELVLDETLELLSVYNTAYNTVRGYGHITVTRRSLAELKKKIGNKNFDKGVLPPPVPTWRFKKTDG